MTKPSSPVETDDLVVLLLGASDEHIVRGITRLEKLVFLLERETPIGELLTESSEYRPYRFGPFSPKIYEAIDTLRAAGLVWDSATNGDDQLEYESTFDLVGESAASPYETRDVGLTELGNRYFAALIEELPDWTQKYVGQLAARYDKQPLRSLVHYVYTQYPEYTTESEIRDRVLGA